MWAFSRLLRLKIESQLREGAPHKPLRARAQPPPWSSQCGDSRNGLRRGREAHTKTCAQRRRSCSPPVTKQRSLVAAGPVFGTSRAPSPAATQRWQVSSGATCGHRVIRRRPESARLSGRRQSDDDIEFGNDP
jgi:hypothetical protein